MDSKGLFIGMIAFLMTAGCVSSSKYRKDLANCADEKAGLQGQVDSLNKEKADLAEQARAKEAELGQLKGTYDQLVGSLKNEISNGEIQVTQLKDQLRLN